MDSGLKALFSESQALQLWHAVFLGYALLSVSVLLDEKAGNGWIYVDNCVLENDDTDAIDENSALDRALSLRVRAIFQLPALSAFVEFETGIVVAFVQVLKDA